MRKTCLLLCCLTLALGCGPGLADERQPLPTYYPNLDIWGVAHRGASDIAPENTLPAIQMTIDAGFRFVELDIHYTRDGVPICLHDKAVDRTTDGSGLIFLMSYDDIKDLDAGSWFGEEFAGVRIPTLEAALQLMQGRIGFYLDQKDRARPALVELLEKYGYLPHEDNLVVVGTGEYARSLRELYPDTPAMPGCADPDCIEAALEDFPSAYAFNISHNRVTPEFVKAAHDRGMRVFVNAYGDNDPDTIRKVVMSGADALQTNHPPFVNQVIDQMRKEVEAGELEVIYLPPGE